MSDRHGSIIKGLVNCRVLNLLVEETKKEEDPSTVPVQNERQQLITRARSQMKETNR